MKNTEPISVPTESRPTKCPTCNSPAAHLHPAMQFEGEVQPCENEWHNHERGKESWERDADLRAAARKRRAENGQPESPNIVDPETVGVDPLEGK